MNPKKCIKLYTNENPIKKSENIIEPKETIHIEAEINTISDILKIIDTYKVDPTIKYNINIKALHNIREPLEELNNMIDTTQSDHIENLLLITGVGPARAKKWLAEGIKNIDDVREAQKNNKITVTHHIDIGIKYYEDFQKMIPRDEIDIMKDIIETAIKRIDSKQTDIKIFQHMLPQDVDIIVEPFGGSFAVSKFCLYIYIKISIPYKLIYMKKCILYITTMKYA